MHGVFDGESADEQSHTSHDPEYRHEEALLVAKQVARRYLIQECQTLPDEGDSLK